jgi:hypothetical protein
MLPQDKPKIADLLGGLFRIGEIRVNIRNAADLFDVQVVDGVNEHPVTRVRVPYAAAQTNTVTSQLASTLVQTVEIDAEAMRPFWRKAWVVAILTNPLIYVALWAFLLAISWIGSMLLSRWAFERRDRQWLYRLIRLPLDLTMSAWQGTLITFGLGLMVATIALAGAFGYAFFGPVGAICAIGFMVFHWWDEINPGEKSERRA